MRIKSFKKSLIGRLIAVGLIAVTVVATGALTACGKSGGDSSDKTYTVAIPNDATNEARALLLLQDNGYIKLKDGVDIKATIKDVEDAGNLEFKEVEAAQIPNTLKDVDFGIINSNFAIDAKLNPVKDSLIIEGSAADYANIIAVKKGNEDADLTKALLAAVKSQKVADFINKEYDGAIVSVVTKPTDGFDASVNYDALKGQTVTVAASPAPHAEILAIAKKILAEKDITLDIKEFTDYVQPNKVVDSGEVYANFFQHVPYLNDFNKENGTNVVSVAEIHNEPMGLYAGKTSSLDDVKKTK